MKDIKLSKWQKDELVYWLNEYDPTGKCPFNEPYTADKYSNCYICRELFPEIPRDDTNMIKIEAHPCCHFEDHTDLVIARVELLLEAHGVTEGWKSRWEGLPSEA